MKADDIIGAVEDVTKKWAKQRKREEREASAVLNRRYVMARSRHIGIKEAAYSVMNQAYLKASANGTLPAHARQVMYAARPRVMALASKQIGQGFDKYFTQTLLPDYMADNDCTDWNVVFDARGHFTEPHANWNVPLGTLEVREYLADIKDFKQPEASFNIVESGYPTAGPNNRYGGILFIEKEGFMPLFEEVKLAKRWDIAITSTKGMSTTAARLLFDSLAQHDIPLFVLHDFDKSGFSIAGTLRRDTRRYAFTGGLNVIDLGLRLADIEGLEAEDVHHTDSESAIRANLHQNGATLEEINFLVNRRVELNAMPSNHLVAFIERKLEEHGVKKIVPDDGTLADAYRRMRRQALVQKRIDELIEGMENEDAADLEIPADLRERIEGVHAKRRHLRWDSIVKQIAMDDHDADASDDDIEKPDEE